MSTIAKAAKLPKADYEILITLTRDLDVVPHVPHPLKLGKTVHYRSRTGEVEIDFADGSPYEDPSGRQKKKVTSNELLKLKREGHFIGRCSITTPDGVKHGWGDYGANTAGANTAGANHDVQLPASRVGP
jgi:hypothetical protein